MAEMNNEFRILVRKSKENLGRHRRRWKDKFIMNQKVVRWEGAD
jgi:hypothetical protein